jgi:molybdopterin converting factor small subunit
MKMKTTIQLKLFATLNRFAPSNAEDYPIESGDCLADVLTGLGIPREKARLIFIDGAKGDWNTTLSGGERVGIFPPVGGG